VQGLYKILCDGIIVHKKNVITDIGRITTLNAIAGKIKGFAESIVVGIGNTSASTSDKKLDFLVSGADISTIITDPVNEKLYFKAVLPVVDQYEVHELGCYTSRFNSAAQSGANQGALLNNFNSSTPWISTSGSHTVSGSNSRLDADSIQYILSASATGTGYVATSLDLINLPADTIFSLAYYVTGISDVILRFKNDDSNYYTYDGVSVTNGYQIAEFLKSDFVSTGSPAWNGITQIELSAIAGGSGGTFSVDGLRYDIPNNNENGLLSRAVLSSPIQKMSGLTMDIEYVLELDL